MLHTSNDLPNALSSLWNAPARATSGLLPGTGIVAAAWSVASGFSLPLPSLASHRVVINLMPLHRHTLWIEGRERRDASTAVGAVRIAPPGQDAKADVWGEQGCSFLQIYVPSNALDEASGSLGRRGGGIALEDPLFNRGDPLLEQIGRTILHLDTAGDPIGALYADQLGHALVSHLVFAYARSPAEVPHAAPARGLASERLRRVLSYAEANLGRKLTVAELASVAAVSPYHFSRVFRASTGQPPHAYLTALRVARARRMIEETTLTMAEIAAHLGFADQSHLARHFRAALGVTPSGYARARGLTPGR